MRAEGDEVQIGMALCTIFTSYLTTAAQACWALALLLHHPDYLESVVAELDAGTGRARLDRAFKESLRLRPVTGFYARTNAVDIELDGFRLPRGWMTMLCPGVAHRLPEVFAELAPERAEDRRRPYALVGFSGGFYRCPGPGVRHHGAPGPARRPALALPARAAARHADRGRRAGRDQAGVAVPHPLPAASPMSATTE